MQGDSRDMYVESIEQELLCFDSLMNLYVHLHCWVNQYI
jgi:hypothetical protein